MDNPVIIFGANSLGQAAMEIFESNKIVVYGFLDDNKKLHGTELNDVTVLGKTDDDGFLKLIGKKCEGFIAEDDMKLRKSIVKLMMDRRKKMPVNAIHNMSEIALSAHIGHGNFINSNAVVGANAKIENHCIINSNATIDYNAELSDLVQIGAGSTICNGVKVGENVFVGAGVTIVSSVTIGKNARVGAGSVVIADVPAGKTVFGNPAKEV